jgi:CHASE1-domain containing sensor protein
MAVPARAIAEYHVCLRLLQVDAVWAGNGQPLENLRPSEQRSLDRLVRAGVIREEGPGRFYLYAPAYAARIHARRQRKLMAFLFLVVAALLITVFAARTAFSF